MYASIANSKCRRPNGLRMTIRRPFQLILVIAAIAAICGIAVMVAHPAWQDFVESNGVNIPTGDRILDYVSGLGWALVLMLSILLWPIPWVHKIMLLPAWLIRCVMTLGVMLPYEGRYYILDCWAYFPRAHMAIAEIPAKLMGGGLLAVTNGEDGEF